MLKITVILTVEAKDAAGFYRSCSKRVSVDSLEGVYIPAGDILGMEYRRLADKLRCHVAAVDAKARRAKK